MSINEYLLVDVMPLNTEIFKKALKKYQPSKQFYMMITWASQFIVK